jgi:hypothetical protein
MTLAVLMSITVALVSATAGSAERNGGITRIRLSHGMNNNKGNVELIRGSKSKTIVDYHTILHDVISFVSCIVKYFNLFNLLCWVRTGVESRQEFGIR